MRTSIGVESGHRRRRPMPLPQPHHRYRVRKRGRRHWDRPRHIVLSSILGTCIGYRVTYELELSQRV
jgi:hypothetical protein